MKKTILLSFAAIAMVLFSGCTKTKDIIIIGGGASGCSSSIAAARLGASVIVINDLPWVGGMLTSAGVSAVDGNYNMRSGIFGEFEQRVADYYGGWDKVRTAWVSNFMFEPHVGEQTFRAMIAEQENITLEDEAKFVEAKKTEEGWTVVYLNSKGRKNTVKGKVLIDCTELGDIAKAVGVDYRLGLDSKYETGEWNAFEQAENIIQDITMVVTLKDYGPDADMTIPMPEGYDVNEYANCCINPLNIAPTRNHNRWRTVGEMMTYGKLPNGKIMLNWPTAGNDIYVNIVEMTPEEREQALKPARDRALGYVYFIQKELGFKNLGLADDEFPSADKIALIPYHRESRRIKGEAFYILDAIERPYDFPFYRAGVCVGDYPVDHHHYAHDDWERLCRMWFYPVPSYCLPAGVTVPLGVEDMLVAEKSISVSNLANGTTRLQPVVTQLGQVVGTIAALAVRDGKHVREVSVREVQKNLLEGGMYIQPFRDLPKDNPDFKVLQRIGCTGLMHAMGKPFAWANETWFRTEDVARKNELFLDEYYGIPHSDSYAPVTNQYLSRILSGIKGEEVTLPGGKYDVLNRLQVARILDSELKPFESFEVDWRGNLVK